jgi:hypothetical protein
MWASLLCHNRKIQATRSDLQKEALVAWCTRRGLSPTATFLFVNVQSRFCNRQLEKPYFRASAIAIGLQTIEEYQNNITRHIDLHRSLCFIDNADDEAAQVY